MPPKVVKPPEGIPDALKTDLDRLSRPLQTLLTVKEIPYVVQANLAKDGYTTIEDLADRWNDPAAARAEAPRELEFQAGENDFDDNCPGSLR